MKYLQFVESNVSVKLSFLLLLFITPFFSFAQLGKYEFTGTTAIDNQNNKITSQPAHATFSDFTRVGVNYNFGNDVLNSRNWSTTANTYSTFIEFKVTAHPGYSLNLSRLSFTNSRSNAGPSKIRVAHNASGDFTTDYLDFDSSVENTETVWDFTDIKTEVGATITFRIYGFAAPDGRGAYKVDNVFLFGSVVPKLKINEFHYANSTVSKTGFVEVIAPKDYSQLSSSTLSLYNAGGSVYNSFPLNAFLSHETAVYGNDRIYYLDIPVGLVDGRGGLSLSSGTDLIQFISYGGTITATSGPAAGTTSQDIGITESLEEGNNHSLSFNLLNTRQANGGAWVSNPYNYNTKGYDNNTENLSLGVPQTLPVTLLFFRAKSEPKGVLLSWATASEINNEKFEVQRSLNEAGAFESIASLKGNGTTHQEHQYTYTDNNPMAGLVYYRLKQLDWDGTISYSPILAVNRKVTSLNSMKIYPNPVMDELTVNLDKSSPNSTYQIQVINSSGQIVLEQQEPAGIYTLTVPTQKLATGTYYLILVKDGKKESKTFMKK
ncbi:T9SS type A sorting domain-containing protein [Adhaeribacter aquaticus]|uniref:T9SS type A sorting domain-containing protein n=1 Tax=Adhaeribacter aquaticus TaxID=299567 RepID=UPI00040E3DE4|nr:T9SS type A sorting domain-containing protein [Adhaeribacter aquaticus]